MHTSHFSVIAGRSVRSWSDWEIKIFLQEWEVVKQEVGLPEREIHRKSRAVSQRLHHRGLTKSWRSCFLVLLTLQDLYRTLCNERPRSRPLFLPHIEALHRILGSRHQHRPFAGLFFYSFILYPR